MLALAWNLAHQVKVRPIVGIGLITNPADHDRTASPGSANPGALL
jgi:hypothetical protein